MKNDLDLPLLPSAEQIRRREFATVRRGYDPDQVREYLQGVAGQVETLERELRDQRKEAKVIDLADVSRANTSNAKLSAIEGRTFVASLQLPAQSLDLQSHERLARHRLNSFVVVAAPHAPRGRIDRLDHLSRHLPSADFRKAFG